MKKDNVIKKGRVIKWTYQGPAQSHLLALAECGQSNAHIKRLYKFTDHEITYALSKAQAVRGHRGGYRRAWANGTSEMAHRFLKDMVAIRASEIQRNVPQLIIHPETQVVKV